MTPTTKRDDVTRLSPRPWGRIFERVTSASASGGTPARGLPYVVLVCALSVLSLVPITSGADWSNGSQLQAVAVFALAAIAAELINYEQLRGAAGSIALIPFVAASLIAPSALGAASVAVSATVVQVIYRRHWLKAVFNVSQLTLGISIGIAVYRLLGGVPFLSVAGGPLIQTLAATLLPAICLTATMIVVNSATVSGVVSIVERRPFGEVWKAVMKTSPLLFIITAFFTYYLTWLYSRVGVMGAAGLVIPLLAIRQLYRTTTELTRVTEELLDLMVAAIEARDLYTSGHSKRVERASRIIAKSLGLSPQQIERVGVAALLHDVGKIDEAFAPILAKEGRLTPEEWEIMKRHPIRGAELVGLLSTLKDVVSPIRHHHENWDGTGYPDGISHEAIPLASRIIMFADTLDAMTTDRPYRKALGMDEARAEFLKFRGRQFDPAVCDRVLSSEVWAELYASFGKQVARLLDAKAS
jgi:HD-GYP domain-containing protein (c-di-GMP phosphodiesterase class II)